MSTTTNGANGIIHAPTANGSINKTPVVRPKGPPTDLNIPVPPIGYVPTDGSQYNGFLPRSQQLAVIGEAVDELGHFDDYAQALGRGAPPLASLVQAFDTAHQWSMVRARTNLWADYCLEQEGLSWKSVRALLDRFQPAFELAVQAEPDLAARFPGVTKLCGALRGVAVKAASTKRANAKAKANGEEPFKGKVGKRRKRAAEAAAYEQLSNAAPPAPPTEVPKPPAVPPSAPPVQPVVVPVGATSPTHT